MAFDASSPNEPPETPDPDGVRPDFHEWCERIFFGLALAALLYWSITTVWNGVRVGFGLS